MSDHKLEEGEPRLVANFKGGGVCKSDFEKLADAICGLDQSIAFLTRNLHLQFDWFKTHQQCATEEDLKHATDKILTAIADKGKTKTRFDFAVGPATKKE